MSVVDRLKKIKEYNTNNPKTEPTFGKIYVQDGFVELEMNGTAFMIEVEYSGTVFVYPSQKIGYRYAVTKNKITISNLLGHKEFIKRIIDYSGNLIVSGCTILTYSGKKIKTTIEIDDAKNVINKQQTFAEDADEVLFYEDSKKPKVRVSSSRGVGKKVLENASLDQKGNFQLLDKQRRELYKTRIEKIVSALPVSQRAGEKRGLSLRPIQRAVKVATPNLKPIKPAKGGY
tara:strand:- start:139 stop:831 length:693 start_codon:yes stop_codon:yes gene_type:complete